MSFLNAIGTGTHTRHCEDYVLTHFATLWNVLLYPLLVVLPLSLLGLSPYVTLLSCSFLLLRSSSGSFADTCDPGACIGSRALHPAICFIRHCSGRPLAHASLHDPHLHRPWPHRRPSRQDPFGIADALVFQTVCGVDSGAC